MNIALVLPPWYRRDTPSPDLAMTVALLKRDKHSVVLHDFNNYLFGSNFRTRGSWKYFLLDHTEDDLKKFFEDNDEYFKEYASHILSSSPDVVVFKIIGHTYYNALKLAAIIKNTNGEIKIIFSGALVNDEADIREFEINQYHLPFDHIICGEDEAALPALLDCLQYGKDIWLKHEGKVIDATAGPLVEDYDTLPHFDFSLFDMPAYQDKRVFELYTARGCPMRCTFCMDWKSESKFRTMSGRRIFEEVVYQDSVNSIKHIHFCNKSINGDIGVLETFSQLMIDGFVGKREVVLSWSGDIIIGKGMTPELFSKMERAGCRGLGYGVESGSDKVLRDMGKPFTSALAEQVIRDSYKAGIKTAVNILVGFPTETEEDFIKTLEFIERNRTYISEIRITYAACSIAKYSELEKNPGRYNLTSTDPTFWTTGDGKNTYEIRTRRYNELNDHVLRLGIPLRVNSRMTKKGRKISCEAVPDSSVKGIDTDKLGINVADADNALILQGEKEWSEKNYSGAFNSFKNALRVNPRNTWALRKIGEYFTGELDFEQAERYFKEALGFEDSPNRAWSHIGLGKMYVKKGCAALAVDNFQKAHDYMPGMELGELMSLPQECMERLNIELGEALLKVFLEIAEKQNNIFYKNKTLNELEIIHNKTILESMPRAVHFASTDRCNMTCPFCDMDGGEKWDLPERVCNEIMDLYPYLQQLVWQGGEAFLHPKFMEMLSESMKFPNIGQTLVTNGMFIDENWVEMFSKVPSLNLLISLESVNKSVYERLRRGGNFDLLKRNIRLLSQAGRKEGSGLKLSLNTLVMKSNYREIEDIADFAIKNEFSSIIITPLARNGMKFSDKEYVSPDDPDVRGHFNKVMPAILDKLAKRGISVNDRYSGSHKNYAASRGNSGSNKGFNPDSLSLCHVPWQKMFIFRGGDVSPYCYCQSHIVGNVNGNSISEMWNNESMQKLRKAISEKNYNGCAAPCVEGLIDENDLRLPLA